VSESGDREKIRRTRVLATILTFEAPESLGRCLAAIGTQSRLPDGILVVDNGRSLQATFGGLPDFLVSSAQLMPTGENLGPAGGHAVGLRTFMQQKQFTHAWVMDDDCVPQQECLADLVQEAGSGNGQVVFPSWVDGRTGVATDYPGWCGFLIDRQAVAAAGLPRSEFFWWAEDTEYLQHRMPRSGVRVSRARSAVVVHEPVRRSGGRAPWMIYYEARNSIYYRLRVQRRWPIGPLKLILSLAALFGSAVRQAPRLRRLIMLGRGVLDGLSGRLGKRVEPGSAWHGQLRRPSVEGDAAKAADSRTAERS